jgi:hypothetical protein
MIGALVGISVVVPLSSSSRSAEEEQLSSLELLASSLRLVLSEWAEWSELVVVGTSRADEDDDDSHGHRVLLVSLVLQEDNHAADASTIESFIRAQLPPSKALYEVELWATTPAPLPLLIGDGEGTPDESHHSVIRQFPALSVVDDEPEAAEAWVSSLRQWGVVTQRGLAESAGIDLVWLRNQIDRAIQAMETKLAIHRPDLTIGQDVMLFQEVASRGGERFDLRLLDEEILTMVRQQILPLVRHRLRRLLFDNSEDDNDEEEKIDFDVSVVYSKPGASTQGWHADGDHERNRPDAGWDPNGWRTALAAPYAICLFLPLIDLTDETGYTQFWPGSHRSRHWAGFGPVAELANLTYNGLVQKGDAIFYDYRLWHRGMPNRTADTVRPVLQVIFKRSWYIERANYGTEPIVPAE